MNKIRPAPPVSLDHGIDAVVRAGGRQALPGMLDRVDIAPADASPHSQLDELLKLPNIGDFIAEKLRPRLEGSELLAPPVFWEVLRRTIDSLRQLAENDPRIARSLGFAAGKLKKQDDCWQLVLMYRAALVQG